MNLLEKALLVLRTIRYDRFIKSVAASMTGGSRATMTE
jgi:hypothetical protein